MLIFASHTGNTVLYDVFRFHLVVSTEILIGTSMEDSARYVVTRNHRHDELNAMVAMLWSYLS